MLAMPGTLAYAVLVLGAAVLIWPDGAAIARVRISSLATQAEIDLTRAGAGGSRTSGSVTGDRTGGSGTSGSPTGGHPAKRGRSRRQAILFAGLAGSAVLAILPSVTGALVAGPTAVGTYLILGGPSSTDRSRSGVGGVLDAVRRRLSGLGSPAADPTLPWAIDLLAVCLRAGLSPAAALRAVASASPAHAPAHEAERGAVAATDVSAVLGRAAAAMELGSAPEAVWRDWLADPSYGPLCRALIVSGESGSTVAGRLESVSAQLRVGAGNAARARAQRVGVSLMAPLGLCFLPAFVCLGVVPVVIGIAGRVFGS